MKESVDFVNGEAHDDLLIGGQREKHARIAVFAGKEYVIAYDYLGEAFTLDTSGYTGKEMWWISPVTGVRSYIGICKEKQFEALKFKKIEKEHTDRILLIQ